MKPVEPYRSTYLKDFDALTPRRESPKKSGGESTQGPRDAVKWFAEQMEERLKANDHKDHWTSCDASYLMMCLRAEVEELLNAGPDTRIKEAADVANFAMMIADNARKDGSTE